MGPFSKLKILVIGFGIFLSAPIIAANKIQCITSSGVRGPLIEVSVTENQYQIFYQDILKPIEINGRIFNQVSFTIQRSDCNVVKGTWVLSCNSENLPARLSNFFTDAPPEQTQLASMSLQIQEISGISGTTLKVGHRIHISGLIATPETNVQNQCDDMRL